MKDKVELCSNWLANLMHLVHNLELQSINRILTI